MRRRYLRNRSDRISYPGLIAAWSAKGKTNDDADRNVLKDLTGNGHDITLNNFAYSGMSGYGGYSFSFKQFNSYYHSTKIIKEITEDTGVGRWLMVNTNLGFTAPEFRIKYKVVGNSGLSYTYTDENGSRRDLSIVKSNSGGGSGEITIPQCYSSVVELNGFTYYAYHGSITIELLPEYPDALVFDGVDDGGVAEINEPKLANGYTFIIEREIIKFNMLSCVALFQEGDDAFSPFGIEQLFGGTYTTWNYDACTDINNIINLKRSISYQTDKTYNNFIINKGSIPIRSKFNIGSWDNRYCVNMAFYSAYLFNRTLTDEEIKSFIRKHIDPEYLLPSEISTPDVYYDFTNGDNSKGEANNVIKDLSGNGNDATAHNFAWNEESGYAGGGLKFDGVDDYISLDAFDSGFKTVFMLITTDSTGGIFYDQRGKNYTNSRDARFVLLTQFEEIAYNWGNINGITYINGKLNTKIINTSLKMKKHLVCVVNSTADAIYTTTPSINQSVYSNSISHAKNKLYKFLGFKEALTEEQIKAVIKKYNLLDGVDNIDVN